jgi:hypothetical protein
MSAGKAIEVLQQHDSFDLRREIQRWLMQEGLNPHDAVFFSRKLYPYVRDYGAGIVAVMRDVFDQQEGTK